MNEKFNYTDTFGWPFGWYTGRDTVDITGAGFSEPIVGFIQMEIEDSVWNEL